jgi:hypothetical protein
MSNRKRNVKKKQGNQPPPQFGLAGWVYLVIQGNTLVARGEIVYSPTPNTHFTRFRSPDPEANPNDTLFFRMMSAEALTEGSLYPNNEAADEFLKNYSAALQERQNPQEPQEPPVPVPETHFIKVGKGIVEITPELQERADENGFTIEQQLEVDAEVEALELSDEAEIPPDEAVTGE